MEDNEQRYELKQLLEKLQMQCSKTKTNSRGDIQSRTLVEKKQGKSTGSKT